ncbi:MAG: ThuA domain-containing protein [Verrucomicrobia bacterium]|nr:ThuA domain-containing protein [Verrucomicrobiota bacterium]
MKTMPPSPSARPAPLEAPAREPAQSISPRPRRPRAALGGAVAGGVLAAALVASQAAEPIPTAARPAAMRLRPAELEPPAEGIKVLVVTGIDYPGHPWQQTAPALKGVLEKDPRLKVRIVEDPEALASPKLALWDTVVLHFMDWEVPGPGPAARDNLKRFVSGGKGLALTHFACGAWDNNEWPEFRTLAGRVWDPKRRAHDPHGTFRVDIADRAHPITRDLEPFETLDELYTCLAGEAPVHVVAKATSKVDRRDYPIAFVLRYGQGRVFHCVLGHDARAYAAPGAGELFRRGIAWTAGVPPKPTAAQP